MIFIIEAALKIFAMNFMNYISNSWNQLDFFIVIASIVDFGFQMLVNPEEGGSSYSWAP